MSNPWFRLYAEFAGDPVVQSLAFEDQRHFVMVLCLKCNGTLDRKMPSTRRDLIIARALGLDAISAEEAKRRLLEVNLISKNWQPKAWDKRQFTSDTSTERTRKYRKNKKAGNVPETLQGSHGDAPDTDTDTDTEKKNIKKKIPPSVDEVRAYCEERKNNIDPQRFIDHYEANGWMRGKTKIKDWKACVRTWERNNSSESSNVDESLALAL